jgi:hypothetical protein
VANKIHFDWMCAYWSISQEQWDVLQELVNNDKPFDLYELGAKELKHRPKGFIHNLVDVNVFQEK